MSNKTVIIIPTYNEATNVEAIAKAALEATLDAHVLFVDDNSPDGTGQLINTMIEGDDRIHVLHRTAKDGLGRAYIAGFKWALERDYELIFEMDADFSHNPKDVPRLREAAQAAGLAIGSRYIGGVRVINWPLHRLFLSRGAGIYVRLVTGLPLSDPTGGFKCFHRCVLEAIDLDAVVSNGYSFQVELNHKAWLAGCKIVEVPIVFEERHSGASKMSKKIIVEALWMVWKLLLEAKFKRKPECLVSKDAVGCFRCD
ncbi:MAG: polyprenol monophosphomannose synthase [Kiritimatiellaceae bacterium]|nr:polyprenol monophosphomannose synthase [Kiritimatiellaceae bacterium]